MIKISPSILSADFSTLSAEAKKMEAAGSDLLHVDVMDGHFVPNLTIGAPVIKSLRKSSSLLFDVHLMIDNPEKLLDSFIDAGSDIITFHYEATEQPIKLIDRIRNAGIKAAVAIKPLTPAEVVFEYLDSISMVLVMTVEPGFGGQKLIMDTLEKVAKVRAECLKRGIQMDIEVDGGITTDNIGLAASRGANVFVSGSSIFKAADPALAVKIMRENAQQAVSGNNA